MDGGERRAVRGPPGHGRGRRRRHDTRRSDADGDAVRPERRRRIVISTAYRRRPARRTAPSPRPRSSPRRPRPAKAAFSGPKITCSETTGACRVAITFTTKKKGKRIVAARAKATIKAGKRATPSLKLLKPAKALLAKQHNLSLTGTVKVTDAAGNTHTFPVKTRLTAKR